MGNLHQLSLIDLHKSYGSTRAVDGVSFIVEQGEILAVLGPSGCGKSTLLALVAGLEQPDQGQVLWDGRSLEGIPPHKRNFGLMFQDYALFPHMNVFDNVAFGLRMAGKAEHETRERVGEVLELVGLPGFERRDVNMLSGGEQQRVALARSLAPIPNLLMLDEPLGSLDRSLREQLVVDLRLILREAGQTAIYVTHDQEEAFALADRVVVMKKGVIEQVGTPQGIYQRPASPFVARFLGLNNLFPGEIVQVDGRPNLKTPIGQMPLETDLSGKVTVLLHPDAVHLDRPKSFQLGGTVVERSFRGSLCRMVIAVLGAQLTFDCISRAGLPEVGDKIQLGFEPQEALILYAS